MSSGGVGSKTNKTLTFLLPLQLETINIYCWEKEGGTIAARRKGSAEGTASAPHQNIRCEYQVQRCKSKQNTHLSLFPAAPYDRYRSGRGGVGSPLQFWEEGSAEEQHTPSRPTSRGEFWVRYDANQTKYSPSSRLLCSI